MFDYLYEWLRNISYYLILVTAVTYVLPSGSYRKYIRFFTGLVLILMLVSPVVQLLGAESFDGKGMLEKYEAQLKKTVPKLMEDMENEENVIEVEDIVIGP